MVRLILSLFMGSAILTLSAGMSAAFVVKDEVNGVTVYRNVKTVTSSHVQDVRAKTTIGYTDFPQADYILVEEEVVRCNRRLRTVRKSSLYQFGKTGYCQ